MSIGSLAARAAVVALVAALPILVGASAGPRVESVSGTVEIGTGEPPTFRPARVGTPLSPGDVVRTGSGGRAELELDGRTVRLYENSLLRLPNSFEAATHEVELERGRSLFDVIRGRNVPFRVRTPEVVVSVKGTRFLVDASHLGGVSVFRGLVEVMNALDDVGEGSGLLVREGFAAVGGGASPLELLMQDAADPWDSFGDGGSAPALPATETLESARSVLEQAIVAEIQTLDPDLIAVPEAPEGSVAPKLEPAQEQAAAPDKDRRRGAAQPPAALDRVESTPMKPGGLETVTAPATTPQLAPGGPTLRDLPPAALENRAIALEQRAAMLERTELDPIVDVARAGARESRGDTGGRPTAASPALAAVLASGSGEGSIDPEDLVELTDPSGPGGLPFNMQVLTSGGPNRVVINFGQQNIVLDSDDVDEIQSGDFGAYGPLLGVLLQLGVDPAQMGDILDDLI